MRRREFITLIGGAAAWPLAVRAQQQAMPVVGFLRSASLTDATNLVTAFRQGLKETGFIEGHNVAVEFGSGENDHDRLTALVTEFVRRPVAVIVGNVIAPRPRPQRCQSSSRPGAILSMTGLSRA